jgi:hypothetical protein
VVLGPTDILEKTHKVQQVQQIQNKLRDKEGGSACLDLELKKPTNQLE